MSELILTNAEVVLPDAVLACGTVVARDGVIAEIAPGISHGAGAIDCGGDLVMPGFIELHTDNLERHVMPRPGSYWPTEAAVMNHDREIVGAGITTVFNAVCVGEVHTRSMRLQLLEEMETAIEAQSTAGALKADHYTHLRCEVSYPELEALLTPLIDHERVRLVSVMDHTPGQRQFVAIERYAEYYQGKFGMTDEELAAFIAERKLDQERHSAQNRALVVDAAHARRLVLASHDDATAEHVDEAVRDRMMIAEFPTTVEAARASHQAGLSVLMGGPNIVRGKSHSGNVSARELAGLGLLDVISSDYVPASLLFAALVLEREGVALPDAIATITAKPAAAMGMVDRGMIAVGKRADLVRARRTQGAPIIKAVWREGGQIA